MKTALITGANRGIGLELCKIFGASDHKVIAVCRKSSDELAQLGCDVLDGVDVATDEGIEKLAKYVADKNIDITICNAGILRGGNLESLSLDDVRAQFEVNSLGPLRVAKAIHKRIPKGGKFVIVTSRMGSMADNGSGGSYGYRMSKAAVNAVGVSLARDLHGAGVSVLLVHPGYVRTGMTGDSGNIDPDEAAQEIHKRIEELKLDKSGRFMHQNGEELPF